MIFVYLNSLDINKNENNSYLGINASWTTLRGENVRRDYKKSYTKKAERDRKRIERVERETLLNEESLGERKEFNSKNQKPESRYR